MIHKLDFVSVPSQDAERAGRFYVETLGLRPDDKADTGVCQTAFFTDPDGSDLMLHHRSAPTG